MSRSTGGCCVSVEYGSPHVVDRGNATDPVDQPGLHLARFTIGYNVVEGVLAVAAGASAGLVSLLGFGLDSAIESISAVLVALRLGSRLRHGVIHEDAERRALRLVAVSFFVLAAYVLVQGVRDLIAGATPETSALGLVVLVASLVIMPLLASAKRRVGMASGW